MNSFLWDILKLVGGVTTSQLITILLSPIITRIYSPSDLGKFSVFNSIIIFSSVTINLQYELAIVVSKKEKESINLLALCFFLSIILSVLIGILLLLFGDWFSTILKVRELKKYLILIPIDTFLLGTISALNYWNIYKRKFEIVSITKFINSSISDVSKILLGVLINANLGSQIIGTIIGSIFSWLLQIYIFLKKEFVYIYKFISLKYIFYVAKRYKKFPIINSWSTLLNQLSNQIPTLLLNGLFGPEVNGYFALGNRFLRLPSMIIGQSLAQVFFQRASKAENSGNLDYLVETLFIKLFNFGLFPIILISMVAKSVFITFFGANWGEAGVYTQILSFWTLAVFISSPLSNVINVLEKQEKGLQFNGILLITKILSLVIGSVFGSPNIAIVLFSITGMIAYSWLAYYILIITKARINRILREIKDFSISYIPLIFEAILFLILFKGKYLMVTINSALIIIIFIIILYKKDNDFNNIITSTLKKLSNNSIYLNHNK